MASKRSAKSSSARVPRWAVWGLAAGFVVTSLVIGVMVHFIVRDLTATWTGMGLNPFRPANESGSQQSGTQQSLSTSNPDEPLPQVTPIPWNGSERINILLMGLDFRDWEANSGAPRSDTMMVVTIDPLTQQGGMLSVPRDLWVEIDGFGFNRINAAYAFGEGYRLPGGGPALAMKSVENVIGVPIHYFAVIEFSTFERLIDEIGGIDVLVRERIKISPIGRQSFWLEPKPYHLDGAETLAYARVRKYGGGDFGRAERQQQVARAVIDRVVGFNQIPGLIAKAPRLFQELSNGIITNLNLEQMIALGWLAVQLPDDNIRSGVIGPPNMIEFITREDGAQVLRPVPDQIRQLRDEIFVEPSVIHP